MTDESNRDPLLQEARPSLERPDPEARRSPALPDQFSEEKEEGSTRMDTTGSTTDSRTAPTDTADPLARFQRDISDHKVTVLRDDGLYRHLRTGRPPEGRLLVVAGPLGVQNVKKDYTRWVERS